jgi:mannan endo-1,4-beta-mannosidase
MKIFNYSVFLLFLLLTHNIYSQSVNFTINLTDSLHQISPYIYGTNQLLNGDENWAARRQGGNRMTGYNWENNASNAGSDYIQSSDNYLANVENINGDSANIPGIVTTVFQNESIKLHTYSLVTLQMAGYVARDKKGTVTQAQTAPSSRWEKVQFEKGSAFSIQPDTSDTVVYMDEYVNFLVNQFGEANTSTGINAYSLDNEPALWPSTHPRIHPQQTSCKEIVQKAISLSKAVKNIDPYAEIFGPALYGMAAYATFQSAPDWNLVQRTKNYNWFIAYYLDRLKQASDSAGYRLLDVLDLHWYPEAIGDSRIIDDTANSYKDKVARVQAPRTLWDKNYTENSWIGQYEKSFLPLIPKLRTSINSYNPGTKLAFTEFTYGGENDISGAIAIDDVLGIFAKYGVYMASFWQVQYPSSYVSAAYKMYRNYDGSNSTFGNYLISSNSNDSVDCSIYASYKTSEDEIHLIVINKNFNESITGNFTFSGNKNIESGTVWELDGSNPQIHQINDVSNISGNTFTYSLPPASVCHFVLQTSPVLGISDNKITPKHYYLNAYPNPFNPSCKLVYSIPNNSPSSIEIISITGKIIKSYKGLTHSGFLYWNGTNENNMQAASGVYLAILRNGDQILSKQKLILLK